MRLRGSMAVLGALTALAPGATTAQAVTPIPLGPGGQPRMAVGGTTAHVAWVNAVAPSPANPSGTELRYCRIAVGGKVCNATHVFTDAPDIYGFSRTFVFTASGNRVLIVVGFNASTYVYPSSDGGATWGPRKQVSDRGLPGANYSAAALGPGANEVSLVRPGDGSKPTYQKGFLSGGWLPPVMLSDDPAYSYSQGAGVFNGHPVASYSTPGTTKFSFSPGDGTSFNGPFSTPSPGGSGGLLRGGSAGLFLLRDTLGHSSDGHLDVSRFTGSAFAAPRAVEGSAKGNHDEDFAEDGGGRLHVVYDVQHGGSRPVSLRYTSSGDGGKHWSTPLDAVRGAHVATLQTFSIAASSFAKGFIAYGTSVNPDGTVYAVPLPKAVCKVPKLKGKSLAQAKKALLAAHCRLGKVIKPKHPKKGLVVSAQNPKAGKVVADKSKVKVKLAGKH